MVQVRGNNYRLVSIHCHPPAAMESQYGIAVTNKYELFLNEDEDPLEILRLQEEAKLKKKDDKPTKKDGKHDKAAKSAKTKLNKKVLTPVQDQKNVLDQNIIRKDGTLLNICEN